MGSSGSTPERRRSSGQRRGVRDGEEVADVVEVDEVVNVVEVEEVAEVGEVVIPLSM